MLIFERLKERAIKKLVFMDLLKTRKLVVKNILIRVKLVISILKNFCAILDIKKKKLFRYVLWWGFELRTFQIKPAFYALDARNFSLT